MNSIIETLRQKRSLLLLGLLAIPLIVLSKWVTQHWNLQLLDGISDPLLARELLASLNEQKISAHLWFTVGLDVILPFAAALFFASVALNTFGKFGLPLAIAPLVALPLDLCEGVIQVLVLTDSADLLAIKAYTTPVKSLGYQIGFLVSVAALLKFLFVSAKNKLMPKQA